MYSVISAVSCGMPSVFISVTDDKNRQIIHEWTLLNVSSEPNSLQTYKTQSECTVLCYLKSHCLCNDCSYV